MLRNFTNVITDRYFWSQTDPEYLGEGFFSMANVLTFIKGTYLLSLDQNLGPLQLTLGLMAKVDLSEKPHGILIFRLFLIKVIWSSSTYCGKFRLFQLHKLLEGLPKTVHTLSMLKFLATKYILITWTFLSQWTSCH